MLLTQHFSLRELTTTATGLNNTPTPEAVVNLVFTALNLEHIRRVCGNRPIRVSSGYRSQAVNTRVGGVPNSQHRTGQAVDISFGSIPLNRECYAKIKALCVYDQLILEQGGKWIHLSVVAEHLGTNRRQAFTR